MAPSMLGWGHGLVYIYVVSPRSGICRPIRPTSVLYGNETVRCATISECGIKSGQQKHFLCALRIMVIAIRLSQT